MSTFPCTTGITRWYPWGYSGSLHTPVRHTEVLQEKFQFGWGVFLVRSEMDRGVRVETGGGYSVLVRTESSMITSSSDSVLVCVSQIRSSYWGGGCILHRIPPVLWDFDNIPPPTRSNFASHVVSHSVETNWRNHRLEDDWARTLNFFLWLVGQSS